MSPARPRSAEGEVEAPDARRLEVRTRLVFGADGPPERHPSVDCGQRGRVVPLDQCVRCAHCSGLYAGPDEHQSFVLCDIPAQREAAGDAAVAGERGTSPSSFPQAAARATVSTIMRREVLCVRPDLELEALAALLLERRISGAPVVNASGKPIAMVSKTDLVRWSQEEGLASEVLTVQTDASKGMLGSGFAIRDLPHATVGDIMTPLVFSLPEEATIAQAAALMAYEGIHRIPIVSQDHEVVGLLSSLDVLRWLADGCGFLVPR